jgi:hypothetical protein
MTEREALRLALKALEIGLPLIEDFGSTEQLNAQHKAITAIYEALAQRTWVGLTDEEISALAWNFKVDSQVIRLVELEVMERNL